MRFQAANQHVDRGRVLRQSGDCGGAINEFARALQIDPGNQAAAQELQTTDKPQPGAAAASGWSTRQWCARVDGPDAAAGGRAARHCVRWARR